jgi:hypothetical protein
MRCTLREWQLCLKNPADLILQASSIPGEDKRTDLWQPFPIGMSWQWEAERRAGRIPPQQGAHSDLVFCAINEFTDMRRKKAAVNRQKILATLSRRMILNQILHPSQYFKVLPNYKFVISPEGNGIDCHRHYEALLAGCIPIVEENPLTRDKYAGCPILFTKDYSEIRPTYLEKKWTEMLDQIWDFSPLLLSSYSLEQQEQIQACSAYWIGRLL